jgi:hypothetical protein
MSCFYINLVFCLGLGLGWDCVKGHEKSKSSKQICNPARFSFFGLHKECVFVSLFQRDWDSHCRKESRMYGVFLHKAWVRGAREGIDSCVFNA